MHWREMPELNPSSWQSDSLVEGAGGLLLSSRAMQALTRLRLLIDRYARPIQIEEDIFQIRTLGAKVTVIRSKTGILLIDAGPRGSLPLVAGGLKSLGAELKDIELVAVTHSHPDHAGGLPALVTASGAAVATHDLEAAALSGIKGPANPFRPRLLRTLSRPLIAALNAGATNVDLALEDGDKLPWPEEVRVIHTPGHTPGSICLFLPQRGLLIPGDAMQYRFRRLSLPANLVTLDPALARESLAKLSDLDIRTIGFSHFAPLRSDASEELKRLLHRRESGPRRTGGET